MELTVQQIQKVEDYLASKNFDFIDLKDEILDHMILDVENLMQKNIDFVNAFAMVRIRWKKHFREISSFYFGLGFSAPKIVIQKAKKVYWKQYVFLLASYFLPFLLLTHFNFKIENPTEYSSFILFKGVVVLSFVAFMYMFFNKNTKVATTYGFILKSQGLGAFTGLIVLAVFFTRLKELNGINIGMFCSFLFTTFSYFHFYKKHKEAINKYQIS